MIFLVLLMNFALYIHLFFVLCCCSLCFARLKITGVNRDRTAWVRSFSRFIVTLLLLFFFALFRFISYSFCCSRLSCRCIFIIIILLSIVLVTNVQDGKSSRTFSPTPTNTHHFVAAPMVRIHFAMPNTQTSFTLILSLSVSHFTIFAHRNKSRKTKVICLFFLLVVSQIQCKLIRVHNFKLFFSIECYL